MENKKSKAELEAITQLPQDIILECGNMLTVYPITIGKIKMLSEHLGALYPLIEILSNKTESNEKEAIKKLQSAMDSIATCVYVLKQPNNGAIITINENELNEIAFSFTITDLFTIIKVISNAVNVNDLLKNVRSPKTEMEEEVLGADTLQESLE